jgi:hypothetical protein
MPVKPINYIDTIIFKIEHTTKPDLFYMGHTTQFNKTKNRIKKMMEKPTAGKYKHLYNMVLHGGGYDEFNFIEVQKFPCSDANEADAQVFSLKIDNKMKLLKNEYLKKEAENKTQFSNDVIIKKDAQPLRIQLTPLKYKHEETVFTCNCGAVFKPDGRNKHVGTKRHLKYEEVKAK